MAQNGPTVRIGGKDYDVNRDFKWRELLTVEELSGVALASDGAFEHMTVLAAFVFIVMKRADETLMWEGFLDGNINDLIGDEDEDEKPAKKPRPTRAPSA